MKFNWGVGITIFIIAFIVFILSFVFKAAQTDTDLVAEDYYEQELNYQPTIDAENNADKYKNDFGFAQIDEFYVIKFPNDAIGMESGKIHFYRPNNAELDKHYQIELSNTGEMAIPLSSLETGYYKLNISWKAEGNEYLIQEEIEVK